MALTSQKKCKHCGKAFTVNPKHPMKTYCSDKCKNAEFRDIKRRENFALAHLDDESRWVWPKELQEWITR